METKKGTTDPAEAEAKGSWRPLSNSDIEGVVHIANIVHPDLPERQEVFAERVELFPQGCLALIQGQKDELCGYAISHPIRHRQPPALNSFLGEITPDADQYYIHDVAILPEFRGRGFAQECIDKLFAVASRYATTCLVSVYRTSRFWNRFGFEPEDIDEALTKKLVEYGDDAVYLERKNIS